MTDVSKVNGNYQQPQKPEANNEKAKSAPQNTFSVPGRLLDIAMAVATLGILAPSTAEAAEVVQLKPDMQILEDFSTSDDSQSPYLMDKTLEKGFFTPKMVNLKPKQGMVSLIVNGSADMLLPMVLGYFSDPAHPVLYNVNIVLDALKFKQPGAIKEQTDPAKLLHDFQLLCKKNGIFAKHFEHTQSVRTRPAAWVAMTKKYPDAEKLANGDIVQPIDDDTVLGRQTVRAMVFVYELGQLMIKFGMISLTPEEAKAGMTPDQKYALIFSKYPTLFQKKLLEFKTFINTNPLVKTEILGGAELTDPGIANVRGNTGEAIIALHKSAKVGPQSLANIRTQTLIMRYQTIKRTQVGDDYPNLPGVIEAKKILFAIGFPGAKDDTGGDWGDDFDAVLKAFQQQNGIPQVSEINQATATALLDKAKAKIAEVKTILDDALKTPRAGKLKNVAIEKVNSWKKAFDFIMTEENNINTDTHLSPAEKKRRIDLLVPNDLDAINRQIIVPFEAEISGDLATKARRKLALAREIFGMVQLAQADDMKKNNNKLDSISEAFNAEVNKEKLDAEEKRVNDPAADNAARNEAIRNLDSYISKGYKEYVRLRSKIYKKDFDATKTAINAISASDSKAQEKLDKLMQYVTNDLTKESELYREGYKMATNDGFDVTPYKLKSPDYDIATLFRLLTAKSVEIQNNKNKGPLEDDLKLMRQKIDNAVKIDINNKDNNDIKEFQRVLKNLNDLANLDQPGIYSTLNLACDKINEVYAKIMNDQKAPYFTVIMDKFNAHVTYLKDILAAKIAGILADEASRRTLAFCLGDFNVMPGGDIASHRMGAMASLYELDYYQIDAKKFRKSLKDCTDSDRKMSKDIIRFYIAVDKILADKKSPDHKKLLEMAQKAYDERMKKILHRKSQYLASVRARTLNDMPFETCLRNEIAAQRLSFAGIALAEAFIELYNLKTTDPTKKITVQPTDKFPDDKKELFKNMLRGVPNGVVEQMAAEAGI